MFTTIEIEEFPTIIELFEKDNGKKVEVRTNMGRLFITGEGNELMLRFNKHSKRITIARILFKHTRIGYGTYLLSELKQYGKANGYDSILIESLMTNEAYQFATKHGFQFIGDPTFTRDSELFFYGDYKLDITNI
ncbi:hypothetical protein [Bacillus cereus group sp. TH152-1LC]|uniref:hypothetical protein n=1 Tax=Bacillus cereus group sp. TH152-1LC TaxID=3018060 RepID=UPI0022E1EEA8|nr:hypothetical protein [Bacillus cereus group sp. TH152-1LC]MDA1675401.1 hypothetical protein [Bacillus cereus group sp. TH152-1LC]